MPARFPSLGSLSRVGTLGIILIVMSFPNWAQKSPPKIDNLPPDTRLLESSASTITIGVRDPHGLPVDASAFVHLFSRSGSYNITVATRDASTAYFSNVPPGEYEVEVSCPGYRTATEHVSFLEILGTLPVYIYLRPESETSHNSEPTRGLAVTPQLRADLERGLQALQKQQFESARKILGRASLKAPGNPDIVYFLGVAELGLQHRDLALENFQHALSLDPHHELALLSVGEFQMQNGATSDAIASLEKAVATGRADWRTHFALATAYFKAHRFGDAESEAYRAVHFAKEKTAAPTFLLGEIQFTEDKQEEARTTWESILKSFPSDPVVAETKKMLARSEPSATGAPQETLSTNLDLPLPTVPDATLVTVVEHPWAPPGLDAAVHDVAPNVNCKTEQILDGALHRMKSQLVDFEKFTATEHIEHQEVDRYGWPGPVRSRDFSYIVLIFPFDKSSFYLEESRGGGNDLANFPTSIATIGLNSLGVSVLQPYYRSHFAYACEGLASVRGQAAWQVRFEEKRDSKGAGVRQWRKNTVTYQIPINGRIWISSANFAVLRVETELRNPIPGLELTQDHLFVDYGPVNFSAGNAQLWLPWSADMYMELHGKRYHHRHFLSDYMLFGVDTRNNIEKPAEPPASTVNTSPYTSP